MVHGGARHDGSLYKDYRGGQRYGTSASIQLLLVVAYDNE